MQRVPGDRGAAEDGFGLHRPILGTAAAFVLAGCEGPLSILDPAGPSARAIATVWWWMLGVAALVFVGTVAAWLLALRRRAAPSGEQARRGARRWLVVGGLLLPSVAVLALLLAGSPAALHQLPLPGGGAAPLRVHAIGSQWRWELHYPDAGVTRVGELRLPAGRAVDVHTESRDVIHSFWVPRLGGKLDAVPGHVRVVRLQADAPGRYRGVCAEYCGSGHADMVMTVVAMEPAAFDAWLDSQRPPAR
ncbi:cytochrome c oxidase subunit II [Rubrivivax gelatinosus]|nr:cytochrome c oxidase subunit II [Rubrivivax gelatinosus]